MAQPIDIILFDLGNVVVDFDSRRIVKEFAHRSGASPHDIAQLISTSTLYHDFEQGTVTPAELHKALEHHLSFTIPYPEFLPIWNDIFSAKPDMEEFIRDMKTKCRIAALSNTNELHWNYLKEKFDIMNIFDDYFLSFQLHCRKPQEVIYSKVLDYYKVSPETIAYIDDVPSFISVARNLGIQGHIFTTVDDVKQWISGRLQSDKHL
ncbi:MAG: HAD family hydrolase [Endomicrobiales bacterium]